MLAIVELPDAGVRVPPGVSRADRRVHGFAGRSCRRTRSRLARIAPPSRAGHRTRRVAAASRPRFPPRPVASRESRPTRARISRCLKPPLHLLAHGKTIGASCAEVSTNSACESGRAVNHATPRRASVLARPQPRRGAPARAPCYVRVASLEPHLSLAPVEAWAEPPAHWHVPSQSLAAAHELNPGQQPSSCSVTASVRRTLPAPVAKRRRQQIRLRKVLACYLVLGLRRELEATAPTRIEQRKQNRRGVEARQREPVDRGITRDQRASAAIANSGVISNRRIARCSHHPNSTNHTTRGTNGHRRPFETVDARTPGTPHALGSAAMRAPSGCLDVSEGVLFAKRCIERAAGLRDHHARRTQTHGRRNHSLPRLRPSRRRRRGRGERRGGSPRRSHVPDLRGRIRSKRRSRPRAAHRPVVATAHVVRLGAPGFPLS